MEILSIRKKIGRTCSTLLTAEVMKVRTPHVICMAGNQILGATVCSIRLSNQLIFLFGQTGMMITAAALRRTWDHSDDVSAGKHGVDFLMAR
jgi:hypothetical protein